MVAPHVAPVMQLSGFDIPLRSWQLAPFSSAPLPGALVSSGAVDHNGSWIDALAPHGGVTVLAALVQSGKVRDPFFGDRINQIKSSWGRTFDEPWWYRTSFALPKRINGTADHAVVHLSGINYRANVWVNGRLLADNTSIVGAYRTFTLSLPSDWLLWSGPQNILVLQAFRQHDGLYAKQLQDADLGISFLDWAPPPPDGNLGLWRGAAISVSGAVRLSAPQLTTRLSADDHAELGLLVELAKLGGVSGTQGGTVAGTVTATLGGAAPFATFSSRATVGPGHTPTAVALTATISHASKRLWWPWQMGEPRLHQLHVAFTCDGGTRPTHELIIRVGLREVRGVLDARQNWMPYINGRRLLVRGAGWSPDLLQRMSTVRNALEVSLARHAGLNLIRFEGKLQDDDLFDRLDEAGLLALPGLNCCDAWQSWGTWNDESQRVAVASLADQMWRLRRHPSLMAFMLSSDELPPPHIEQLYTHAAHSQGFSVPLLAAASWRNSTLSGPTGLKMSGPCNHSRRLDPSTARCPLPSFLLHPLPSLLLAYRLLSLPTFEPLESSVKTRGCRQTSGPTLWRARRPWAERGASLPSHRLAPRHSHCRQSLPVPMLLATDGRSTSQKCIPRVGGSLARQHSQNSARRSWRGTAPSTPPKRGRASPSSPHSKRTRLCSRRTRCTRTTARLAVCILRLQPGSPPLLRCVCSCLSDERSQFAAPRFQFAWTVVQWMLNNAWPSNTWHLYDTRLAAGGAFYGARTACAPALAIQRHGTSGSIFAVNSRYVPFSRIRASAEVWTLGGRLIRVANATLPRIAPDSVARMLTAVPVLHAEPALLRLRIAADLAGYTDETSIEVTDINDVNDANDATAEEATHRNDYILPPTPDAINFTAGCGNGGCADVTFADMTSVAHLPFVQLVHSLTIDSRSACGAHNGVGSGARSGAPMSACATVVVGSPADAHAVVLGVHLRLLATDARTLRTSDVLPVLWDDDYFALVPGESRTIRGTFTGADHREPTEAPMLVVESLNAALKLNRALV